MSKTNENLNNKRTYPSEVWEAANEAYTMAINDHMNGDDHIHHVAAAIMDFRSVSEFPYCWHDELGPLLIMCAPSDGYVMARRPSKDPFVIYISDLAEKFEPFPLDSRSQISQWVKMVKNAHEAAFKDLLHGE